MTLEYLKEQKETYQQKQTYFKNIGFDTLAADFQGVVNLIGDIENYMMENNYGKQDGKEVYD